MRNPRQGTPSPHPIHFHIVPDVLHSKRSSLLTPHLPSLAEGSLDCNMLARTISPVFSPAEVGKTDIADLAGSPSLSRRKQVVKSAFETWSDSSKDISKLPNLDKRDLLITERKVHTGSPNLDFRSPRHKQLRKAFSQPAIMSKSDSFPKLNTCDLPQRKYTENERSAEIRRHIHQENVDYDLLTSKAAILERYLNSQKAA